MAKRRQRPAQKKVRRKPRPRAAKPKTKRKVRRAAPPPPKKRRRPAPKPTPKAKRRGQSAASKRRAAELREAYRLAREQELAAAREERKRKRRRPAPSKPKPEPRERKRKPKPGTFAAGAADALTLPPRQRRGEKLTPEQLLPDSPWRSDPRVKKWIRNFTFDRRFRRIESDYRTGEAAWFPLPEHTALHMVLSGQHPVSLDVIKQHARQVFEQSGRNHMRFRALLLYWYPDNPNYRGALVRVSVSTPQGGTKIVERNLARLARTWKPMWTKWMFGSTPEGAERAVDAAFYRENQNGVSPAMQAEERVIYLVAYELFTFDNVTPPESEELAGSPLRAV